MLEFILCSAVAFAQEATAPVAAATAEAPPVWTQFVPFAVILAVMYFVIIRPQGKKQKETQDFLSGLKVGDQVITAAGILGRITSLSDVIATLEIANQVQIKVLRSQVLMNQSSLQSVKKEGK
jgi:preprotein translocase subunit YajC